ncbi:hypothetical protein ABMC88_09460 [Sulfitobacter sp. HNIBRBA2951]|uniref:hypothetical protein n=1 Tax=Sulfitobacter aquimarinus TaxID=3158557 RepID=UPI0032DECAF0
MRYDQAFRAEGYHSALLTTFSFDPTVFENVILIGMRSRGCRNIGIIVDQNMLNRTLSEAALAPRAGTAYHLAKRKVSGAFHPKIALRLGPEGGSLMVGSANLTGAGLVGNMEAVSEILVTLQDMRAAPLLAAALEYFERHADPRDRAMRDVLGRARAKTPWLSAVTAATEVEIDGQRVSFVSEVEGAGVGEAFVSFIGDDVIDRLVAVSPYWDHDLRGLEQMRESLGAPESALVVESGEHDFSATTFMSKTGLTLHSTSAHAAGGTRRLHAKLIIACGQEVDYVLSGSANISEAGLFSRFDGTGNAEACIMRTEPAGAVIDRLELSICLSEEIPLSHLRPRMSAAVMAENEPPVVPDGGALWIDHGMLFWQPPSGVDKPDGCRLELTDSANSVIGVFAPSLVHGQWSCEFDTDGPVPRVGHVIFDNETASAPIPIASLGRLRRSSEPASSGRAARLLADLEGRSDLDEEDYERALKIIMASRQEITVKRDVQRDRTSGGDDHQDYDDEGQGERLTDDEYRELAPTREEEQAMRSGPVAEMRRFVNSCLGLSAEEVDEDDDGALTKALSGNGAGGGRNGGQDSPQMPKVLRKKASWTQVNERADRLALRVRQTCDALAHPDVEPLSFLNAVRLHILINVVLKSSAAVGARHDETHPISATEPARSWIRLLGRLLQELEAPLERQVAAMEDNALEEECIDALATILFTAGLVLDAARQVEMSRAMIAQLEAVNAGLARSVMSLVRTRPAADAFVRRAMPVLSAAHAGLID